ncbi:hypothetical protein [Pseudarthrobacter sp. SSS035]|uniref:hypothetical protein n=1 Tax=Pseudarthrobacter sp. SSS035 TaxID=2931399 RepID=UPI00200C6AE9|nr:hypothetical protein [Pseudarthrobacter sp. SSS035]
MELSTIAEIVRIGVSVVLPVLAVVLSLFAKSGAGKSLVRHLSFTLWHKRMRKAGFSKKEIRDMMAKAVLADLSQ